MTPAECRAFLLARPARTGKLATVRRDGRPHVVPVWFDLDGDDVVFTTGRDTVKGRTLRRDPRAAMCVDDDRPPFDFVSVEGTVELGDDLEELRHWATRIGGRYMGAERAEEFGARNAVPGERLARLRPERVFGFARVAD
jgi:PPOX class probable F420-dependent enzyme